MGSYQTFVKALVVLPVGDHLFSEFSTTVSIDDEAAGPFVVVEQEGNEKIGRIQIDAKEWPAIKAAIEAQLEVCRQIEANETSQNSPTADTNAPVEGR